MANNTSSLTVVPSVPNELLESLPARLLLLQLDHEPDFNGEYFFAEDVSDAMEIDDEVIALAKATPDDPISKALLEAIEGEGEDPTIYGGDHGLCYDVLLQAILRLPGCTIPHFQVEGADTCSKMRPGEHGGFAFVITKDDIQSVSTSGWIHATIDALSAQPSKAPDWSVPPEMVAAITAAHQIAARLELDLDEVSQEALWRLGNTVPSKD